MFQVPLVTSSSIIPLEKFWSCILLYHNRPHIINKKLVGVSSVLFCKIDLDRTNIKQISTIFRREALIYETRKLGDFTKITNDFLENVIDEKTAIITPTDWNQFDNDYNGIFVSVRILFGRTANRQSLELVVFDKSEKIVTFFAVQECDDIPIAPQFPYHIQLTNTGNLRIILDSFEDADTNSAEWLADRLFNKLLKWCEDFEDNQPHIQSLSLIEINQYCRLYSELKMKYSDNLLQLWPSNATTDPKKYIYEDIAIATYLICLWYKFPTESIRFVDCGCGNGLLVYLLNKEGYSGYGIDVRRRKIWDIFENTDLRIGVVDNNSTFSDCTWIIGNHSDELTPWIPVIALKSSPHTNFFVLPCCPYDFNGKKYERFNSKISQYCDYMNYIENISQQCRFLTKIDKLRIPSTKRTCLIGIVQQQSDYQTIIAEIDEFIEKRQQNQMITIRSSNVEKARNCTQLDRNLVTRLVNFTINKLLTENTAKMIDLNNGKQWNSGGTISLNDLIKQISKDDLKLLKNECGGMQTLLKNHRYLFEIKNGKVSMRKPPKLTETDKYKEKICWFLKNHPDGCLYEDEICGYKH